MNDIHTGDTYADKGATYIYKAPDVPVPYTFMSYSAANKADEDKIASSLSRILEEDLTIRLVNDAENRQSLIYGLGDQQLEVVASKLESRYKVKINLNPPRFAYRETIMKKASDINGTHKKQSGGHGQYGVVIMDFEPSGDLETPYIFEQVVVGGSVPKNYFPAVEKGIAESVLRGPLAGYPVVGIKATLKDGKYHPVDSSEMAFKTAAQNAFKDGVLAAKPVLLEPIARVKVVVPNDYTGDVMGDLNKRRGRVLGMEHIDGGKQVVTADVPMAEMFGYSTDLRSRTQGRGNYSMFFEKYEQVPKNVQEKIIANKG
jgi:elongation factor G